mmetsp:Transcript_10965/g.33640  ORF Transcript_10965/g.33640 Transcript_10965/m.33640 type:complete len:234 (+) Transcript_10965:1590-2291(+)
MRELRAKQMASQDSELGHSVMSSSSARPEMRSLQPGGLSLGQLSTSMIVPLASNVSPLHDVLKRMEPSPLSSASRKLCTQSDMLPEACTAACASVTCRLQASADPLEASVVLMRGKFPPPKYTGPFPVLRTETVELHRESTLHFTDSTQIGPLPPCRMDRPRSRGYRSPRMITLPEPRTRRPPMGDARTTFTSRFAFWVTSTPRRIVPCSRFSTITGVCVSLPWDRILSLPFS